MSLAEIKSGIIARWDQYWFTPESLRRLAICRVLIFAFMIWDLINYRETVYSLSQASAQFFKPLIIIQLFHLPPPTSLGLHIVFYLLIGSAVGALIGFKTKVCILVYLLAYTYWIAEWFSFGHVHHGHSILVFFTACLLLSPSGEALSVDGLRARIKAALKKGELQREEVGCLKSEYARWPLRLIQTLLCLIYFLSGYAKMALSGPEWANGYTLQYYLIYHPNQYGLLVAQNLVLCQILSVFTLLLELGFPLVLFFPKLAWLILPSGFLFHLGTGILMGNEDILAFPQLWFCYIAFINFDSLGTWLRAKLRIPYKSKDLKVLFDGGCPLCIRSATFLCYFDWFKRIDPLDLRDWESISRAYPNLDREACTRLMHIVDGKSRIYAGFFAFRRLTWVIPVGWILLPMLYLPGVPIIGQRAYHWVARNRVRTEIACTSHTCKSRN